MVMSCQLESKVEACWSGPKVDLSRPMLMVKSSQLHQKLSLVGHAK